MPRAHTAVPPAEAPDLEAAVAVLRAGKQGLRLAVGLHRLDRIAETAEEPTLIEQELRFFARPHRVAGRDLRIEIERALVGTEPLMQHGETSLEQRARRVSPRGRR